MATNRAIFQATPVAQVNTFTPGGTIETGDLFILTLTALDGTTEVITFAATATTVANVVTGLKAAWDASSVATAAATASDDTTHLTLTAVTAGTAFSVVQTTTEADGGAADAQTFATASVTANAGPKNYNDTANWSLGVVPVATDDVIIEGDAVNYEFLYGLDQSAGGTYNSLRTSGVGFGTNPAAGILPTYFQVRASIGDINKHEGPGSVVQTRPIFMDFGSVASEITVHDSGANATSTLPTVWLKAASASTNIKCLKGKIGVAYRDGETSTVGTIETGYVSSPANDVDLRVGSGTTLTTATLKGGSTALNCAATTVNADAGTLLTDGSGAITTLNARGATCDLRSTGTISTAVLSKGSIDTTKTKEVVTISSMKTNGGDFTFGTKDSITFTAPDNDVKLKATAA